jgi:hypothetical protein
MKTLPEKLNEKPLINFHSGSDDHIIFFNGLVHVTVHIIAIFGLIVMFKIYYEPPATRELILHLLKISSSTHLVLHTLHSASKTWRDYLAWKNCDCFFCQKYEGFGRTFVSYFLFIYTHRL